jgi:amino acid transporter
MKKQYRSILITAIILTVTIINYLWISASGNTRAVESLSSFAMGALTGILILQIAQMLHDRKNNNIK